MYDTCVNFKLSAKETQRMTLTIRLLIWDYEEIRFTIISDFNIREIKVKTVRC